MLAHCPPLPFIMSLLVTGGLGFLGMQVARHYLKRGVVWAPRVVGAGDRLWKEAVRGWRCGADLPG